MVGVLASYKSLRSLPMREQWAKQTPPSDKLGSIFFEHPQVLNLIHYSAGAAEDHDFDRDLIDLSHHAGLAHHGFQLNMAWPSPTALHRVHGQDWLGGLTIVLQIGPRAIALAGGTLEGVVDKLKQYTGLAQYVLLDGSGGLGRALNVEWARQYLRAFRDARLPFSLGVAGGLGPNSMEPVQELIAEFPDLSWDAQGRLRNRDHALNTILACEYLDLSYALVR